MLEKLEVKISPSTLCILIRGDGIGYEIGVARMKYVFDNFEELSVEKELKIRQNWTELEALFAMWALST